MLDSDLLTVRDVAMYLRVDDTTVRGWIAAGKLPALRLPRRGKRTIYRIRMADLTTVIDSPEPSIPDPIS